MNHKQVQDLYRAGPRFSVSLFFSPVYLQGTLGNRSTDLATELAIDRSTTDHQTLINPLMSDGVIK